MTPTRSVVCPEALPPPPPPPASSSSPHAATPSPSATTMPSATSKPRRIGPPSSDGERIHQTIWLLRGAPRLPHELFGFFVHDPLGDGERGVRGGDAAVDRGLGQDLLDL